MPPIAIDKQRALTHLLDLLAIEGLSGHEANVAAAVRAKLLAAGCRPAWLRHDDVHQQLEGFEIGNLIVRIPANGGGNGGPRRLFMGHLDTVPLCRGAKVVRRGHRITSAGDDRARRRQPNRVRGAGDAGRDSAARWSPPSAAHHPLHRRRGGGAARARVTSISTTSGAPRWASTSTAATPPRSPSAPSAPIAGKRTCAASRPTPGSRPSAACRRR